MEEQWIDLRGKIRKYDFDGFEIGEIRKFKNTKRGNVISSIANYVKFNKKDWKWRTADHKMEDGSREIWIQRLS